MKTILKWTIIAIVIALISIKIYMVGFKDGMKTLGELDQVYVGKNIYLEFMEDEEADYKYIVDSLNTSRKSDLSFWRNDQLIKLIVYMRDNKYLIKEGKYTINQAWDFERVKKTLEFVSK
ncbi:MAG: hypothetical protein N4A47_04185 [Clostridia bacterium]|jgi:hypothetical protein|nr:hypothetical protein [Clostridia bacterium]